MNTEENQITQAGEPPVQTFNDDVQNYPPIYNNAYQEQKVESFEGVGRGNGNIVAGVVGAFLFSIIGGIMYFILYQVGVVAGLCGLVTFVLANFGYNLFAKPDKKSSMVGLIISAVVMVVMIFIAEYVSLSYVIFQNYKDYGITIFDAIASTSDFLAEPEISGAVAQDLVFAYVFGVLAVMGNIVNNIKARRRK